MSVVEDYFKLKKEWREKYGEKTLLLMQIGSFMECYGVKEDREDVIYDFSRICELAVGEKKVTLSTLPNNKIVMAGVTHGIIEKHLKKMVNSGYTVVLYTQDESKSNTTRSLAGVFSPGTYLSIESQNLSNNLSCIWIEYINSNQFIRENKIIIGISNIDIFTGETNVFQYENIYSENPTTYDDLERYISIYKPSEAIVISNLPEKKINDIIQYVDLKSSKIHKHVTEETKEEQIRNSEKQTYQQKILEKYYPEVTVNFFPFIENSIATQSLCYLLEFANQHNPHLVEKVQEPKFENVSSKLYLANYSLRQLGIIEQSNSGYEGKYSCVSKMLNMCKTPMGKRRFEHQLLNPIKEIVKLNKEYEITEKVVEKYEEVTKNLQEPLQNIKDITKWFRFMLNKKIPPSYFCQIHETIKEIIKIIKYVSKNKDIDSYFESNEHKLTERLKECNEIKRFIESTIEIEVAKNMDQIQNFEMNFVKRKINDKLDDINENYSTDIDKLVSIKKYFNDMLQKYEKKKNITEYVKMHETEKNNFSLISTDRRCKILKQLLTEREEETIKISYMSTYRNEESIFDFNIRGENLNFHKQNASGSIFINDEINLLCRSINVMKTNMKDILLETYVSIVERFTETYKEKLHNIMEVVSMIDVLHCKAKIAVEYNLNKPIIVGDSEKSFIDARNLRHIIIENLQKEELYVSNDFKLGKGDHDGMLVYGTNAVGKTSLIKAVGISLIMAQAGLYVPASSFEYYPYDYLFTRILGNDNLFKGLSTFAVEMSELNTILKLSNKNSLILGDELCSGTEIASATCIFVAGLEELTKNKSTFIFATHLHEIVEYEEIKEMTNLSLKHMSVVYNAELDQLIYDRKLKDGTGTSMYGLEVCKSLNLPKEFIENAYKLRSKYNDESKSILSLKTSKYNSKKIISNCEICKIKLGDEVHHIEYQKNANERGIINDDGYVFHKNNLANLLTVCSKCHDELHRQKKQPRKKKTLSGKNVIVC